MIRVDGVRNCLASLMSAIEAVARAIWERSAAAFDWWRRFMLAISGQDRSMRRKEGYLRIGLIGTERWNSFGLITTL
jgi:hypothetical protein